MPAIIQLHTVKTEAWGQWRATAVHADGRSVSIMAPTPELAEHRARNRVPCHNSETCQGSLGEAEARLSQRTRGAVLCSHCARIPNIEPTEEND